MASSGRSFDNLAHEKLECRAVGSDNRTRQVVLSMPNLEFNRTACAAWASSACVWSPPAQAAQAAGQRRRYAASTSSDTLRAIDAKRTINASRARSLVQRMEERNGTRPAVVY